MYKANFFEIYINCYYSKETKNAADYEVNGAKDIGLRDYGLSLPSYPCLYRFTLGERFEIRT